MSLSKMLNPELCLIEQQSAANRCTVWMCVWLGECKKNCTVKSFEWSSRLEKRYINTSPFILFPPFFQLMVLLWMGVYFGLLGAFLVFLPGSDNPQIALWEYVHNSSLFSLPFKWREVRSYDSQGQVRETSVYYTNFAWILKKFSEN